MFHGKIYRVICVRATEFNGDRGDISIIDKFDFRGMCNLAIITGEKFIDGGIEVFVGLGI